MFHPQFSISRWSTCGQFLLNDHPMGQELCAHIRVLRKQTLVCNRYCTFLCQCKIENQNGKICLPKETNASFCSIFFPSFNFANKTTHLRVQSEIGAWQVTQSKHALQRAWISPRCRSTCTHVADAYCACTHTRG